MSYNMRSDPRFSAVGKRRSNQGVAGAQLGQNQFQQQPQQQKPQMAAQQQFIQQSLKQENNQNGQQQPPQPLMQIALEYDPNNPSLFGETEQPEQKQKPWMKGGPKGKINKAEIRRRRNMRLSKILNPKNAVMILNELVKNVEYFVSDAPISQDGQKFMATATFEGQQFTGFGRTKVMAKNEAAENAIKHVFRTKRLSAMSKSRDMNMDVDSAEGAATEEETETIPWQHIASFALYKLFDTWGEPMSTSLPSNKGDSVDSSLNKSGEVKPAKKLPENPELINPLMLMNQMLPHAVYEELGQSGTPPNMMFTFKCMVNGKTFLGTGTSKKAAKKIAAFAACHDILNITYPPEIFVPSPANLA